MATPPFTDEEEHPQNEITPSASEAIAEAIRQALMETRVSVPGTVVRYDHSKQLADVRPDFMRQYQDGTVAEAPIIYNVPVKHMRAGEAFVHVPVAVGHKVWVHFADRSLEKWLTSGKPGDPEDTRAHHLSDAVAYPGGYPFSDPAPVNNATDLILKNDELEIRGKPGGRIQILNSQYELIKILDDWITADIRGDHGALFRIRERLRTFLVK